MEKKSAFDTLAPAVLQIYHRDTEAFWEAVMAPFLSGPALLSLWRNRKVNVELLTAFQGLDNAGKKILRDFSAPLGFDVTEWKSLRAKAEYFKDAYPIFAFLAIWMDEAGLREPLDHFGDILRAAMYGIAGYGILDVNVDGTGSAPVEILTASALVAEYESALLNVFGVTPVNLGILHRIRSLFLQAEITEKRLRGKASPYSLEIPKACGFKAAHLLTAFMLSLESLGKSELIEDYFDVFFLFGAVIQIIDDWKDLEDDLSIGHYSYVTLGFEKDLGKYSPRETARRLRGDAPHVRRIYERCKTMIADSQAILQRLNDPFLARIVTVTDLRLDSFFRKELKMV